MSLMRAAVEVPPQPHDTWTDAQQAFFDSDLAVTLWWGANGIGKTDGIAEGVTRGLAGELHWQSGPGARTVMVVGQTMDQLAVVLEGVAAGRAKRWFRKGIRYESGRMRGQQSAIYDIVDGPGRGGKLICKTFSAGPKNIAGPRAEVIFSDEPLPEPVYNELLPRLLGRQGRLYITYTPTLLTHTARSYNVAYLWEAVDDADRPFIGEIHTPLTLDAVTPRGNPIVDCPWLTQGEIDMFAALVSPIERAMRLGLSRHPLLGASYFGDVWGSHLIAACQPPVDTPVGVGIDHGSKPGAERVMLVAVEGRTLHSHVWVLDEWSGTSKSGPKAIARSITAMLKRNDLGLGDVEYWVGDRAHGGDRRGGAISNLNLKQAFAVQLGADVRRRGWTSKLPRPLQTMWPPPKSLNSDYEGMARLGRLMVGDPEAKPPEPPQITVSPRCTRLHADIENWQGSRTDPCKDGLDALRYIVAEMTQPSHRAAA